MRLHQRLPLLNPYSFLLLPHHPPHIYIPQRLASHAAQGRANKAAPGPGKRLGAKKTATQLVVPGNIIFRQRGTHWFPGENCGMGRDHTIFAREKGYVVYYSDNSVWRKGRKFIGVVRERGMVLPRGRNEARRRVLGLVGRVVPLSRGDDETAKRDGTESGEEVGTPVTAQKKKKNGRKRGYMYRETNWDIGRAAERTGVKAIRWRVKKEEKVEAQAAERNGARKPMGRRGKLGRGKKRG